LSAPIDIAHLREWVGREQQAEQVLAPFPAAAMAGLLDREAAPKEGDELPVPWHWLYFLETPRRSEIGVDGHPKRGGFLPPVPLPRRMWAASRIDVMQPLVIGQAARKVSTVGKVDLKQGKTGPLVFVTVKHELRQGGATCLLEEQDIVYREAPTAPAPLPPGEPAPTQAEWTGSLQPDAALLARFSALTYNGHRIHYDRDYAVREEFYPALVVHGPLLATLLLDLQQRCRPKARLARFEFRALRPAFDTDVIHLRGQPREGGADLWTAGPEGFIGLRAQALFD
jgi:3-methylfumaryl-CoA hydratase